MKCIYHLDADGHCAAYLVALKFNNFDPNDYIRMNYGWDIDSAIDSVAENETVIIVDFSLEPDKMRELLKKTSNVIWIDHHYSAIKKYDGFETDIKGLRYDGIAGCMLTYCYFFEMNSGEEDFDPEMVSNAPMYVKYIANHDIWKFEYGDNTRHFILGFQMSGNMYPYEKEQWDNLNDPVYVEQLIQEGSIAAKYRDYTSNKFRKTSSFEYQFGEYKALCFNYIGNSAVFGDQYNEYDVVCLFNFNGKFWSYSFYSHDPERVNCAEIAESYKNDPNTLSAGGHKGAAGLQSKLFIF